MTSITVEGGGDGFRHRIARGVAALAIAAAATFGVFGGAAHAAGTVKFVSPADGSKAQVGTVITPTGLASGSGTGGSGLDLAIVIDVSGSTSGAGIQAEKDAAKALIAALPPSTSSVSIVAFSSSASTVKQLTPLVPASNITALNNAIDALSAGGGTFIGSGIDAAIAELTGPLGDPSRSRQMVVLSDGFTSGDPAINAAAAVAAGIDNVHSVGLPGASVATMEAIAVAGNGTFTDLTTSSLDDLIKIFEGTGGSLVGVKSISITLPDGTVIDPNSVSGIGAFTVDQGFAVVEGTNTRTVTALFEDGTSATSTLTIEGTTTPPPSQIPLPAGIWLSVTALGGLGAIARRRPRR